MGLPKQEHRCITLRPNRLVDLVYSKCIYGGGIECVFGWCSRAVISGAILYQAHGLGLSGISLTHLDIVTHSLVDRRTYLLIPKLCLVHHTFTRQCPDVLNWCIGWTHLSNKLVTCCPSCEGISSSSPRGWVSKVHLFLCQRESERQWERYLWFAYSTCLNSRIIFILE